MERQTIALPLLVTPVAPAGEQKAPACTIWSGGRAVVGAGLGVVGLGFGVVGLGLGAGDFVVGAGVVGLGAAVVRLGLTVPAIVRDGPGLLAAEAGPVGAEAGLVGVGVGLLLVGGTAAICRPAGADAVAFTGLGLPGPKTVIRVAPPQHSTARASSDTSTTGNGRIRRLPPGTWSECGATGSNHGSCGVGELTVTPCGQG